MIQKAEDVGDQGADAAKAARADDLGGDFAKEAFHQIEPGGRGGNEMDVEPGMTLHARFAQAGFAGHRAHAPGPAVRSPRARQTQGPPYSLSRKPRFASPSRGVLEPLQAFSRPSLPPTSNGQKTHSLLLGDLLVGESPRQPQMIRARKTSRWLLVLAFTMRLSSLCWLAVTSIGTGAGIIGTLPKVSRIQSHLRDITLDHVRLTPVKTRILRE